MCADKCIPLEDRKTHPELSEEKFTEEKSIDEKDEKDQKKIPLEIPTEFASSRLDKIPPFVITGEDVSTNGAIQEVAFLSILNMLTDEQRLDFLKWAKIEQSKQEKLRKTRGEKIVKELKQKDHFTKSEDGLRLPPKAHKAHGNSKQKTRRARR